MSQNSADVLVRSCYQVNQVINIPYKTENNKFALIYLLSSLVSDVCLKLVMNFDWTTDFHSESARKYSAPFVKTRE